MMTPRARNALGRSGSHSRVHRPPPQISLRVSSHWIQALRRSKELSYYRGFWNISFPLSHLEQLSVPLRACHHCYYHVAVLSYSIPSSLIRNSSTDHSLPSATTHVLHIHAPCYVPLQPWPPDP